MVSCTTPALLNRRDAAKYLAISERTLFTLTATNAVAAVRIGRSVRYAVAELEAFVKARSGGSAA